MEILYEESTVPLDIRVGLCCIKAQDPSKFSLSDHWNLTLKRKYQWFYLHYQE